MAQIIFEHVTKKFGEETVLNDISFEIERGEFVFVIGKSGAGKSTLLDLILKQENVTSGQITVNGRRVDQMKGSRISAHRRGLGFVSSEIGLLKDRTVYDNIMFAMQATEQPNRRMKSTIKNLLELVGLSGKMQSYPEELSGGEEARILLARALSVRPGILIADEPTANLDPDASWDLMQLLAELNYRGMTIIVASHARELVTIMKKRCLILLAGNLVADEKNSIYNSKMMDIFEERRILAEGAKKEKKALFLSKNIR